MLLSYLRWSFPFPSRSHNLIEDFLFLGSYSLSTSISVMFPEPYGQELCCRRIYWSWALHDKLLSVVVFCNDLSLTKKKKKKIISHPYPVTYLQK